MPALFETDRLFLERLRYEDAEEIFYAYASKEEATKYLSWATHRTTEDTRAFLRYAMDGWNNGTDFSYAIRSRMSNRLIGSFGLMNDEGKVQFGYVLSPAHWGLGLATEACARMMDLLQSKKALYRVSTFVDVDNVASIRVLEKSGLIREATLQKWYRFVNQGHVPKDCALYYLPLSHG